ncbi:hypothetical protein [Endozoicomonas sp.]|uniref:hypothetical protein n=1 Tax=Endozoicomonas sp. TaxID=1892382 RepID=UPI002886ED00|nr:hypothetical protein [Endozoicomonas sp.]
MLQAQAILNQLQSLDLGQIKTDLRDDFKGNETRNFTIFLVKTQIMKGEKLDNKKLMKAKTFDDFFNTLETLADDNRIKILKKIQTYLSKNTNATSKSEVADGNPSESLINLLSLFIDDNAEFYGDSLEKLLGVDSLGDDIRQKYLTDIYQEAVNKKKCKYFNGIEGKLDEILEFLASTQFFSSITREPIYLTVKLKLSEDAKKMFNTERSELKRSIYIKPDNRSLLEYDKNVSIKNKRHSFYLLSKNTAGNLEFGVLNLILELGLGEKTGINDGSRFIIRYNALKDGYKELAQEDLKLAKEKLGLYSDKVNVYDKGIPDSQMTDFKKSLEYINSSWQDGLVSIMTRELNPLEEAKKIKAKKKENKKINITEALGEALDMGNLTSFFILSKEAIEYFHQKMNALSIFTDDELKTMMENIYKKFGE